MRNSASCTLVVSMAVALMLGLSPNANCRPQTTSDPQQGILKSSVQAIAKNPARYVNKTVQVVGKLENEGKNYFTDLRIVLKDNKGNSFYVRPWLPTELPPSPPGYTGKRPPVLSQFLGKEVELTAVVERGALKNLGEVYMLNVKSAKVHP